MGRPESVERADLHNHSCLSPCGDLDNSPIAIATRAAERGITVMALTDHNSTKNCPAFADACARVGLTPIFGTETTTREEVHALSLFETLDAALSWGAWVYERLPAIPNNPERFGDQVIVDVDEAILGFEERFLIPAIDASLEEIGAETIARGGLFIPAHIDRATTSISSQLGFLPPGEYHALEVIRLPVAIDTRGHTLICDSDAHYLEDIGRRSFTFSRRDGETAVRALRRALAERSVTLSIEKADSI
jgi:hypothetical protein